MMYGKLKQNSKLVAGILSSLHFGHFATWHVLCQTVAAVDFKNCIYIYTRQSGSSCNPRVHVYTISLLQDSNSLDVSLLSVQNIVPTLSAGSAALDSR